MSYHPAVKSSLVLLAWAWAWVMPSLTRAQDAAAQPGPFPAAAMAWTPADKDAQRQAGAKMLAELQAAIAAGNKTFVIPRGDYRFAGETGGSKEQPAMIELRNARNITIDASGSTFWNDKPFTALLLTACEDMTIKNVNIDYDPLPFVQGRVVATHLESSEVDVEIAPGYDVDTAFAAKPTRSALRGIFFDPRTREFKDRQTNFAVEPFWDNLIAPRTYRVKIAIYYGTPATKMPWQVGDLMALWVRESRGRAVRILGCANVVLEDVNVYASPFVTFVERGNTRAIVHRRVNIVRRPGTDRLIASNADGFNSASCLQGPVIDHCRIDHITDDFVNCHDIYYHVWTQEAPTTVLADRLGDRGQPYTNVHVDFYAADGFRFLGRRQVVGAEPVTWTMQKEKMLLTRPFNFRAGGLKDYAEGKKIALHRLVLDQPIDLPKDTVVSCPDLACPGTIVRDCAFTGSLARGILLKAPHSQLLNNHISYVPAAGISLRCEISYWREGVLPDDCLVQGNTLDHCAYFRGDGEPNSAILIYTPGLDFSTPPDPNGWITGVRIVDNTILDSNGEALRAAKVRQLTVAGNTITRYNLAPSYTEGPDSNNIDKGLFVGADHGMVFDHVQGLTLENNTLAQPGPASKGEYFRREVTPEP